MRIQSVLAVAAVVLVTGAVAVARHPGATKGEGAVTGTSPTRPAVSIRGGLAGLYPGATRRVRLRVENRSPRAVTVTSLRARALDAGRGCRAANLETGRKRIRLRLRGGTTERVRYRIGMDPDAGDRCQGARFPIRYRARIGP